MRSASDPLSVRRAIGVAVVLAASACAMNAVAQPAAPPPPRDLAAVCDMRAENHQLDFWLAKWDVYDRDERVAESTIEKQPGSCSILQSYAQVDGYSGRSINFYDAALKKWRQTWIDSNGAVGEFTGEPRPGEMVFTGETHRADGSRVHRRMTLGLHRDGSVRQHSLASSDGGATWKPHYDFTYRRRP